MSPSQCDAAGLLDLHWWLIKIVGADGPVLIPTVEICGGLGLQKKYLVAAPLSGLLR